MPPMPPPSSQRGMQSPSNFDKWKMGAMMGGSVGMIMGLIYGGYSVMKFGAGPNGVLRTLGQYMAGSGATFGFFMSIGSVIRTEGNSPIANEAFSRVQRRPLIMPRQYARRPDTSR